MVDVSNCLSEFLKNHSFLHNLFNLFHSFILITDLDNFFIFFNNLFDPFHDNWNFDDFLNNILNVLIDIDELRNNPFDFYDPWHLNELFFKALDFIDFGDNN